MNRHKIKSIAVYCGSRMVEQAEFAEAVVEFAKCLVDNEIRLVFGGSKVGTMKLLADTVLAYKGKVTGVFTNSLPSKLLRDDLSERYITETLAERKAKMIELSDAIVALPGGVGTWDELFDAIALRIIKRGGHNKPIGLLNVSGYYDKLIEFMDHAKDIGFTSKLGKDLVCVGETPQELLDKLSAY